MNPRFVGLLLALAAFAASAGGHAAVRKHEASMVVTGTIDIAPGGSVAAYALDKPEALPESVVALAGQVLPRWRFEPVVIEGKPVRARAAMSLRHVASQQEDGNYQVEIRSAAFGKDDAKPGEALSSIRMTPPRYPRSAMRAGIGGTAHAVVRVGRDGKVEDAVIERVNLRVVASERVMKRGRELLEDASLAAARQWIFMVPQSGPEAGESHWNIRVPITYSVDSPANVACGEWDV